MIKTIFIAWFQGFDNAPDVVKMCLRSWKHYNPDWNIICIDDLSDDLRDNLRDYILLDDYNTLSIQERSNIIRCILLHKYGGVWADATTFCNKPLNDWLPDYIKEGFFAFNKPRNDWLPDYLHNDPCQTIEVAKDRLLSNWFLYAEPNNYIIHKWMQKTVDFHKINKLSYPYFIHHYLFGELYESDATFKEMWNRVPKIDANHMGPHYLDEIGFFNTLSVGTKLDIDCKITPLYKLSYKPKFPEYDESKNIFYLYSTLY